jgi:guanylate kinase
MTAHPKLPQTSPGLLLVVAGPAGSGKTTLCERLVAECEGVERVVTSTTRQPREGEVDGRDYFFFSDEKFDRLIGEGAFLEWASVHDRRYGTLRRVIQEKLSQNIDLCMNVDVQGVANLRRAARGDPLLSKRLVTIFLVPPDLDELRRRLKGRGQDDEAEIERRMETAIRELEAWMEYDFCIRSSSRDADFAAVLNIFRAEKNRVARLLA